MGPAVISIVSKKKSGKTTLIEKLIPELKSRGYRVGTVKHDMHGFDIDHAGKDTWRHKQCGAQTVVISSPWKLSLIKDVAAEESLDAIVGQYFQDLDIVITEGYKRAGKPQVEVFRSAAHKTPLSSSDANLLALVSDTDLDLGVPRFDLEDINGLADLLEATFLKKSP